MTDNANDIIKKIPEAVRLDVLGGLLSQRRDTSEKIFAFKTHMGRAPSYISSVPLSWVSCHVQFAGDMPEFQGVVDEESKSIELNNFTLDHIVQRRPDWRRQHFMSAYLAAWDNRKFPPLLIVGREKWVGDSNSDNWDGNDNAERESLVVSPLGDGFCELTTSGVDFYALDGQHRLMAIQGLQTLLAEKKLPKFDQNRKERRGGLDLRNVAEIIRKQKGEKLSEQGVIDELRKIMSEKIGVEIIPAVLGGESIKEAKFRLRNVFVDVNENAKKLTRGESVLLDEKNGFRMAARAVMVAHPILKKKGRVSVKTKSVRERGEEYTTLDALVKIAERQIGYRKEFKEWGELLIRGDATSMRRPKDADDLEEGKTQLYSYFNGLKRLPSHDRMVREGLSAAVFRGEEHDHILFRPVAQIALAEASAILDRDHDIFMDEILNKLEEREKCGQLRLKSPDAPWRGVIWNPAAGGGGEMLSKEAPQALCARLLLYLLGGEWSEKLRDDYAKARNACEANPVLPERW